MKRCSTCGQRKETSAFNKDRQKKDGLNVNCRKCESARHKAEYCADPEKHKKRARNGRLKNWYGLSEEAYGALLRQHDGKCAICRALPRKGAWLCIDHDHETGAVRGLLCTNCNTALGGLQDSPDLLRAAAAYLDIHNLVG